MTPAQLIEFFDKTTQAMRATMVKKNADYAGPTTTDAFANFTTVEKLCPAVKTEYGFFTRMTDKFKRIASFVEAGVLQVKEEPVEDALLDMANYCILFAGYLRSEKVKAALEQSIDEIHAAVGIDKVLPLREIAPAELVRWECTCCGALFSFRRDAAIVVCSACNKRFHAKWDARGFGSLDPVIKA